MSSKLQIGMLSSILYQFSIYTWWDTEPKVSYQSRYFIASIAKCFDLPLRIMLIPVTYQCVSFTNVLMLLCNSSLSVVLSK